MRCSIIAAVLLFATACQKASVEWSDVSYVASKEAIQFPIRPFPDSTLCRRSLRMEGAGADSVATWWSVRSDSSARLMFTRTLNGAWMAPTAIDTTDASSRGCTRPAPAIAADRRTGYVNIAYFLEQASGPGVFFTHSMDETGFHDPVSISFGKRPSEVSIATQGDRVAVAYEEPNAERGQIWLALSKTMGHIFEERVPVSGTNELAGKPWIRLTGTKLDVEWNELVQTDSVRRERTASRTGTWN